MAKAAAQQEEIRSLASEIYSERTKAKRSGDAFSDWIQAEKIIKSEHKD